MRVGVHTYFACLTLYAYIAQTHEISTLLYAYN
jgi:hypothetical protein